MYNHSHLIYNKYNLAFSDIHNSYILLDTEIISILPERIFCLNYLPNAHHFPSPAPVFWDKVSLKVFFPHQNR